MWSTPSVPLLQGPVWPGVAVAIRTQSMDKKELLNHLTVYKQRINV